MKMSRMLWPVISLGVAFGPSLVFADTTANVPDSTPILRIGTTTVTESEFDQKYGAQLYDAENNLYTTKANLVNSLAHEILFQQTAKSAGMTLEAWKKKEIDRLYKPGTPEEIDALIKRMQGSNPTPPAPEQMAQMKQQATHYVEQQKRAGAEQALYTELSAKTTVQMLLVKPVAPRVEIPFDAKLNPFKGPKNAPVTIVEFTDFQCPWCQRSQPTLKQVEQAYGDKLRVIAHNFPLPMHPRAEPAAEAVLCAKDQNKYWEYREKLFEKQELSDADFKRYAKELSLNEKKFDKCVAGHKYAKQVQEDMALGQKSGVQGTPTFFVNGVKIGFNELDQTVKDELAKPGKQALSNIPHKS
jgi:protein-disulfide isomerase